jgi:hypothetical protein
MNVFKIMHVYICYVRVMWVPVTTAWRVLGLWMEETASRYGGVAANVLNKPSPTADIGWSSSLGVGRGANNSP